MLDQNFHFQMKCMEKICFHLSRWWNDIFVIVKMIVFGIDGDMFVLGVFYISISSM